MSDRNPTRSPAPRRTRVASIALVCVFTLTIAAPLGWRADGLHAARAFAEEILHPAGFADVVERVKPAVVSVRVQVERAPSYDDDDREGRSPRHEGPSDRFFHRFGAPRDHHKGPGAATGQGSGFFISSDGYAVTNNHVVSRAAMVEVLTADGQTHKARVAGADELTDLALLKVDGPSNFPFVSFSGAEPRVGDWVLAIGNPFGLSETVTAGIVSARSRNIGAGPYDDFIQIDAAINKGASGGPVFNVSGYVIGVTNAIITPTGASAGIGFAIPAGTVKHVVEQLREKGRVTRGWLGVEVQNVTPDIAESLGMKDARGALISRLQSGSPAEQAGMAAGSVVVGVNGAPIKDARDLAMAVSRLAPGAVVKVDVVHHGESKTFTATLGELQAPREARSSLMSPPEKDMRGLGLALAPAPSIDGAGDKGVAVTWVDPMGVAASHGVQAGDVILEVGGSTVSTPTDVRKALGAAHGEGKRSALVRLKSSDGERFLALPVGKNYFGG